MNQHFFSRSAIALGIAALTATSAQANTIDIQTGANFANLDGGGLISVVNNSPGALVTIADNSLLTQFKSPAGNQVGIATRPDDQIGSIRVNLSGSLGTTFFSILLSAVDNGPQTYGDSDFSLTAFNASDVAIGSDSGVIAVTGSEGTGELASVTTAQVIRYVVIDFESDKNNQESLAFDDVTYIPEPASLALLGLGGLAIIARRRA